MGSTSSVRVDATLVDQGQQGWSATHTAAYTITSDGSIAVKNSFTPAGERIPLARIGVRLMLNKSLDRFTYLGRGPMENYSLYACGAGSASFRNQRYISGASSS